MLVLPQVAFNSKLKVFSYATAVLSFIVCYWLAFAGKAFQKLQVPSAGSELQLPLYHCKTSIFIKQASFPKIREVIVCNILSDFPIF